MNRLLTLCLCVCAAVTFAACDRGTSSSSTTQPGGGSGKRIAVIPKGTTHVFWKTVEAGARKAADEAGV